MKIFNFYTSRHNQKFQTIYEEMNHIVDLARSLYVESENLKKEVANEKASLEASSSASTEISSMISTTAESTQKLKNKSDETSSYLKTSDESLKRFIEQMNVVVLESTNLQQSVSNKLSELIQLTETLNEIKSKTKLINDIVFQTKLLSFNASVEAARAGEHGRGFSVVAEEMGNLAKSSGQASTEIENIIDQSVNKTKLQISSMIEELNRVTGHTIESINQLTSQSKEIQNNFGKIFEIVSETDIGIKEITTATGEQKTGVEQITQSISDLDSSASFINSLAQNTNKISALLSSKIESINSNFISLCQSEKISLKYAAKEFDFDAAIKAHVDWKMKLTKYLENPDGSLDHHKVCKDDQCPLGKWIYGDGKKYKQSHNVLYEGLRTSHASFHVEAASIVEAINSGKKKLAENKLSTNAAYIKISDQTIDLIKELKNLSSSMASSKLAS